MDPIEVADLVDKLKLTAETTEDGVNLTPNLVALTHERAAKCLVGKIFASKVVNRETLRTHLPQILQIRGDFEIEIVGDNLFLIAFSSPADRRHTLLNGPWHFFQRLILFKEPTGFQKPSEVRFDDFSDWVQCHNIPISCMDPVIIRKIGEKLGMVEEIDMGKRGSCMGMYARVRVLRQVNLPLRRCIPLTVRMVNSSYFDMKDCRIFVMLAVALLILIASVWIRMLLLYGCWLKAGRTQEVRRKKTSESAGASLNHVNETTLVKHTLLDNGGNLNVEPFFQTQANGGEGDKGMAAVTTEEVVDGGDSVRDDSMLTEQASPSCKNMKREANGAAHALANYASANVCSLTWKSDFPSWLISIVQNDLLS